MSIKSCRVLKNDFLRHFYANLFVCVIFTQYICSIKLKILILCTHTNIHILLLPQIV